MITIVLFKCYGTRHFYFCFPGRYMLSYWLRRKKITHIIQKETLFCVSALCLVIQMLHSFQLFISLSYNLKKKDLVSSIFLSVRECSWYLKILLFGFVQSEHTPECTWTPGNQSIFFQFGSTFKSSCPGCVSGSEEANSFRSRYFSP